MSSLDTLGKSIIYVIITHENIKRRGQDNGWKTVIIVPIWRIVGKGAERMGYLIPWSKVVLAPKHKYRILGNG
jgi:hypothetical protein